MQTDDLPDIFDDKKSKVNEIDEAKPVHEDIQTPYTFADQISNENVIKVVELRVEKISLRIFLTEHVDQVAHEQKVIK